MPFCLPPVVASRQHMHSCACGDYYVCSRRDGCDSTWTCPACEQQQLDEHVEALSRTTSTEPVNINATF